MVVYPPPMFKPLEPYPEQLLDPYPELRLGPYPGLLLELYPELLFEPYPELLFDPYPDPLLELYPELFGKLGLILEFTGLLSLEEAALPELFSLLEVLLV